MRRSLSTTTAAVRPLIMPVLRLDGRIQWWHDECLTWATLFRTANNKNSYGLFSSAYIGFCFPQYFLVFLFLFRSQFHASISRCRFFSSEQLFIGILCERDKKSTEFKVTVIRLRQIEIEYAILSKKWNCAYRHFSKSKRENFIASFDWQTNTLKTVKFKDIISHVRYHK